MIAETTPIICLNRTYGPMGPHDLLDGHVHVDTVAAAPLQGALVTGDATPEWDRLVHPAAAGYALTTTATDTVWDQTPDWSGLHTFDAGGLVGTGQDWDPEDASGQKVIGYRAPNAYIAGWMVDALEDLGFRYDSSVCVNSFYNKTDSQLKG